MVNTLTNLNLVGNAEAFTQAMRLIRRFAACDATVLIQGETGTGKEVAARGIHHFSDRRDRPFVPVNCGALPDTLLESELFGHERGAFTDAREAREGLVATAAGGTLFLDEIETLSPRGQVVLLRFLQDRSYRPVGGRRCLVSNARIIAASNADLGDMVKADKFRLDLLYRLGVLVVTLPPLRERPDDITLLAETFLDRFSAQYGRPRPRLAADSLAWLQAQAWPGNVRELESLILREFLLCDGDALQLGTSDLHTTHAESGGTPPADDDHDFSRAKALAINQFEQAFLDALLTRSAGNMSLAARLANQDRGSLNRLIRKHGIKPDIYRQRPASAH
jgi:transcriptional regulator with PAS, ATPase and Fis domain